ncbi:MAG: hypothetical protein K6T17_03160 [Fimbriimonadales bacterium]|nr:hypothetical protein [Fimbriimonadales bacterium]
MEESVYFQANRLILEPGHKVVVDCFSRIPGYRLVLRPARKRLFVAEPQIPSLQVELNKPAFAALVARDDPEARPVVVFETDHISPGIRELYRKADIPFVEADRAGGRGMFSFERPGFAAKLKFDDRGEDRAVDAILRWSETAPVETKGRLIRNEVERRVVEALSSFVEEMGLAINHQVPFGYAAGYREDLPRTIARHTIEVSVTLRPGLEGDGAVILPIRVETSPEIERDVESVEKDRQVAEFVCSVGMPMAAIQPAENGYFQVTYSLDGYEEALVSLDDREAWQKILKPLTESALQATGKATVTA